MIYTRLLLIATIIFVTLSTTTVIILSQSSTRQVGTPICEIYPNSGQPGRNCASIRCSRAGYSGLPPRGEPQVCTPTHPDDQSENHCESNGSAGCELDTRISCNPDQRSASFGRSCTLPDGTIRLQTVDSPPITCPVTCPGCPTPSGNKPCRRAVWNTTYCSWDRTPCDTAGGGNWECIPGCGGAIRAANSALTDSAPDDLGL